MNPGRAWPAFLAGLNPLILWLLIWLAALAVPFLPWPVTAALAGLAWLSALILAPERLHGRRLVGLALLFLLFWALMLGLIHLLNPASSPRQILNLAAWLALGLNLMLAKTPLALARPLGRALAPAIGRLRAQKLALALTLLARLIPSLLNSALQLKKSLDHRAPGLNWRRRLSLWGRALARLSLSQGDELARALLKRWPW